MQSWLPQAEGEHREFKNSTLGPSESNGQVRVERVLPHENAA